MRKSLALFCATLLCACLPDPDPATPALWLVEGSHGERGWLFGTIHALERRADWKSPAIKQSMAEANLLAVEVAGLTDPEKMTQTFTDLGRSPDQPPLSARIDPTLRPALAAVLEHAGMDDSQFHKLETWAAALTLAGSSADSLNPSFGVDKEVLDNWGQRPVREFEGARGQLSLFDTLPEKEQRDLLESVVRDGANDGSASLAEAWLKGDMTKIEAETRRGMLADPELRAVLYTNRNHAWSDKIAQMLASGEHPFVAVGAAHMVGNEGLVALLAARGYKVTRVQ